MQIETQAPKKIQERREKIERDIAAEGIGMTPWHELPVHIKITYQSQAQYERWLESQGEVEMEVNSD